MASANTYCMNRINGRLCHARIPITERLCADCKIRQRGHLRDGQKTCPSPGADCTCGFSELFWKDVKAAEEGRIGSGVTSSAPASD